MGAERDGNNKQLGKPPLTEKDDFYKKTIDIIYAFIIGQSFLQLDGLFIPVSNVFSNYQDVAGLFLAYFIIVTGWIGYHRSVTYRPHRGNWGTIRYVVDLFILFLVYYLLRLSNPGVFTIYGEIFVWLIPLMFLAYSIWDCIRMIDYQSQDIYLKANPKRVYITIIFGALFLFLGYIYSIVSAGMIIYVDNKTGMDIYFIFIYMILILFYRLLKWDIGKAIPA